MCGQSPIAVHTKTAHYRQTIEKRKLKAVAKDLNESFSKVTKTSQIGIDIQGWPKKVAPLDKVP